jgi:spoIIIJ-associated protein
VARVEFQGRDLSEAIARAAEALNLPPETLKFQVVSMGAKGFLGLGRRKARIAVDPDDLTRAEGPGPDSEPASLDNGGFTAASAEPERPGERKNSSVGPAEPAIKPTRSSEAGTEKGPGRIGKRADARSAVSRSETTEPTALAALVAVEVLQEILVHMGFSAEVTCEDSGGSLTVSLDGPDNALLIGSRGATLEALQLLAAKIVTRRLAAKNPETDSRFRLVVDVAGYRARRQRHLLDTLQAAAQEVRRTRRPQTVSGLNAAERHMLQAALRPHKDLGVRSGGRDSLVVIPARRRQG